MIFYKRYNFAFQHINRCGGITVRQVTHMLVGDPDDGSYTDFNICHNRLDKILTSVEIDNIPIYINIRNPFDRVVSIYQFRKLIARSYKNVSFSDFFYNIFIPGKSPENGPQEVYCCIDGLIPSNVRIIMFEDINDEWPKIIEKHFGFKLYSWPKMNPTKRRKSEKFTDKMRQLLFEKDEWVFENFYRELM